MTAAAGCPAAGLGAAAGYACRRWRGPAVYSCFTQQIAEWHHLLQRLLLPALIISAILQRNESHIAEQLQQRGPASTVLQDPLLVGGLKWQRRAGDQLARLLLM